MVKNKIKDNILIRRKLLGKLREKRIGRVKWDALDEIDKFFCRKVEELAELLGVLLVIKGKKTLEKKDVKEVIGSMKKNGEYFEV